jgi:hypothetical protein
MYISNNKNKTTKQNNTCILYFSYRIKNKTKQIYIYTENTANEIVFFTYKYEIKFNMLKKQKNDRVVLSLTESYHE